MEWRSLALKNIWHNIRRYLSYLLASTMAVMVFSLFFIFLFNPRVYGLAAAALLAVIMILCVFIVGWFAIFFIFYFHAALINTRNKEFGLFMTLGMTPSQVARLIFFESLCIGLAAILLGMLLGILGSPLFVWAMGSILGLPNAIPFELSPFALLFTIFFFGLVFLLEALFTSRRVKKRTPRALILGARVRQISARASLFKVIVGLLCIGISYVLAIFFSSLFVYDAIPIVILAMVGTFFIFGEVLVMVLNQLRKQALSGVNLLIVSRLAHRLKDYARILAVVTILNASVLTGMGSVYGFLRTIEGVYDQILPIKIQLSEEQSQPFKMSSAQIYSVLKAKHLNFVEQFEIDALTSTVGPLPVTIISTESYERLRTAIMHIHPDQILPDETSLSTVAHLMQPASNPFSNVIRSQVISLPADHKLTVQVGSLQQAVQVDQEDIRLFNQEGGVPERVLVVNDQQFANWQRQMPKANQWHIYNMHSLDQQQNFQAATTLRSLLGREQTRDLDNTLSNVQILQFFAVLLFAGTFVSALFLFSAGSALYFKLFTQQEDDRRQFAALARIGLRKREGVRIIASEFLLLFFLPVLVAAGHSAIASLDLIHLMRANSFVQQMIWSAQGTTIALYALCFGIYYLVALMNYFRRVRVATV